MIWREIKDIRGILWITAITTLVLGCGGGSTGPKVKQDGRIYVENAWREDDPIHGPWIQARVKQIGDRILDTELKPIPYGKGPIEITPEVVPGGDTAVVHIRTVRWRTLDWDLPFEIDGSIVIRITGMVPDAHDLWYEVRSYAR